MRGQAGLTAVRAGGVSPVRAGRNAAAAAAAAAAAPAAMDEVSFFNI